MKCTLNILNFNYVEIEPRLKLCELNSDFSFCLIKNYPHIDQTELIHGDLCFMKIYNWCKGLFISK